MWRADENLPSRFFGFDVQHGLRVKLAPLLDGALTG